MDRHAVWKKGMLICIRVYGKSVRSFVESSQELRTIKGVVAPHEYGCGAGQIPASPVFTTICKLSTKLPLGELVEQGRTSQR